ncbi:MAG TPA: phosphoribosylglycinamide formyltransferase [Flavobacterium sp.]|jgi:phosphoribosylglycinamide formyltransferase-1
MKHIVLFASGAGSNAENIIRHFKNSAIATVAAVFTNNPKAGVLDKAVAHDVPIVLFTKEGFEDGTVLNQLHEYKPNLIVLAGFLLKIPTNIIKAFPNRIVNIHPALLPNYGGRGMYGIHVHRAVLESGDSESGISIHFVDEHYDSGDLIFQERISIEGCASEQEIAEKIHDLEYEHFPRIITQLLDEPAQRLHL